MDSVNSHLPDTPENDSKTGEKKAVTLRCMISVESTEGSLTSDDVRCQSTGAGFFKISSYAQLFTTFFVFSMIVPSYANLVKLAQEVDK